jgi:hypothetical protein
MTRMSAGAMGAAVVILSSAGALAQSGLLDQSSPATNAGFNLSDPTQVWQQQVRAGTTGRLTAIRLTFFGNAGAQAVIRVRKAAAWAGATPVLIQTVTKTGSSAQQILIDASGANITLVYGEPFVIEAQGNNTGMNLTGNYVAPPGSPMYPEPLYRAGHVHSDGGFRFGFETWMLAGTVPPCYANCDGNVTWPLLTVMDFTCFMQRFAQGDPYANCDGSTAPPVLNVADFTCFMQKFAMGCP